MMAQINHLVFMLVVGSLYYAKVSGCVIKIDPNNGNDTDSCITGDSTQGCKSLEWAFTKDNRKKCTNYVLEVGTHLLQSPTDNFEGCENLVFSGNTSNSSEVVIFCTGENTGLGFFQVSNLTISNLTITNCSSVRNSSSRVDQTHQSLKFQVGLYFYLCNDVSMQSVIVKNSPSAIGVVMYDTGGTNQITDCQFYNNSVFYPVKNTASPHGGGGGLYVEFTYCKPGSPDCDDDDVSQKITRSKYQFTRCTFKNNVANYNDSVVNPLANYIVPSTSNHMAFGRGGGLSIFVNGDSHSNTFNVMNCTFSGNKAAWGGGMFLEFHDKTYNNSISVVNSKFTSNKCNYTQDFGTAGGGMRMGFYVYKNVPGIGNNVNIESCDFENNSALNGGGLSISAALHNVSKKNLANVTMRNCQFLTNVARLGSALHTDRFPLFLVGQMLTVHIIECSFYENSVNYLEPLRLEDVVPYQPGEGTVYIHGISIDFQQSIKFINNTGSGLAIVKAEVDFSDSFVSLSNNTGNRGGGIALLGAAYVVINNNTNMLFYNNTAAISGGAIYNKYISRLTLGIDADCFVRHTNPVLHANDWNANFTFQLNRDRGGSNDNAIHTTSLLPCSWVGRNQSGIFCWKGWVFKDNEGKVLKNCTELISSDIGSIKFNQRQSQSNHYKSFPGQPFNLHLDIKDDRGYDVKEQTVFLASTNSSGSALGTNGDLYSYIWGTNTTVWGESGSNITLQLDTVQNREWHLKLFLELQPCPPGFILTNISLSENNSAQAVDTKVSQLHSCSCSGDYGRSVICHNSHYSARLANGKWMGYIDPNNRTYVSGYCPSGFCFTDQKSSHFLLPNNSKDLEEQICGTMNRTGILCGKCIDDYGPAVNLHNIECVNCTDPVGDTLKYVSAVYIPLLVMFLIIILFKVRLTIGAANAFILYAQVISSTFSIDANGHVPLNLIAGKHTNNLLKAYWIPYGIFNLEFFENLIPPLCVGTELNALAVKSLDYAVALAPLVMIFVVVTIFRISSYIGDRCCKTWYPQSGASSRAQKLMAKKKRSLSEAMLPAFSAFLLLSYTKLALTPSYILSQNYLVDNNGNKIFPPRASLAGYLPINDRGYILHYMLPAYIVLATFVVIPPLLLLDYPLRLFEWGLSKVKILWRFYPVGKIHFILDTFQGCFKNKCRFFAGLYFVFRLVVNINFSFIQTWLGQLVIQEIVCILMIMLVSIFQPYNKQNEIFNRIDVLIFTNLATVNSLSIYLYEYSVNNPKADTLPASVFVIEYILIFLPLIYIIGYILWRKTRPCHKKLPCCKYHKRRFVNRDILEQSCDTLPPNNGPSLLDSNSYRDERSLRRFDESEELLFQRAKVVNLYRPPNQRVMVNESQEKKVVTSTRQTNVSEDSGLRSLVYGSGINYGSTGSSTNESSGASNSSLLEKNSILYQSDDENSDNEN